ncbi:hypothetical protein LNP04_09530 [Chryseobacterium sp. C-71]|uniref:hypothetical protein n=1 Tax=Chryseobacterium sp. C-71 TaxID=2893882 RepID=UPI001E38C73A|nr:hypothetical protein [Chryseobacterium sp. C-71]UFH33917.1 hypothetical protein LNP04_09530 [Chryseobacterium sp. C-71]
MKSPNHYLNMLVVSLLLGITSCKKPAEKPASETETQIAAQDTASTTADPMSQQSSFDLNTVEDSLALRIKEYITKEYLKPEDLKLLDEDDRKFNLYQIDLNNDGKKEVFINFFTPYFCGSGGCSLVLLDSNLKLINKFTVTRTPISIDSETENGWKVLWLQDGDSWKVLTNKNGKYPSNPSSIEVANSAPESNALKLFNTNLSKPYSF